MANANISSREKVGGQMLMAMAEVVLEMVALILEGIEGFILDFPAGATSFHNSEDVVDR